MSSTTRITPFPTAASVIQHLEASCKWLEPRRAPTVTSWALILHRAYSSSPERLLSSRSKKTAGHNRGAERLPFEEPPPWNHSQTSAVCLAPMFDLQDAKRAVRLDLEADTIVADAEPGVAGVFDTFHVAFTGLSIPCNGMQGLGACPRLIWRKSAFARSVQVNWFTARMCLALFARPRRRLVLPRIPARRPGAR